MLSISRSSREEERKEDAIRRQIALLQAQLPKDDAVGGTSLPPNTPPRGTKRDDSVLAPATPSPKKRKVAQSKSAVKQASSSTHTSAHATSSSLGSITKLRREYIPPAKPAPSALVVKLASLSKSNGPAATELTRSSGFTEAVKLPQARPDENDPAPLRDDRLALIEDVPLGPADHSPPSDDPNFKRMEPNSGIRLSSREIPYDDFQDHLRGRYILSPSRLYATARIAPDKQSYEIPLAGDFVTIAVVAERGPIRTSRAPVTVTGEDDAAPGGSDDEYADVSAGGARVWQVRAPDKKDKKGKGKEEGFKRKAGKKYVNLKLVDFGARSASSASGGKAVIRGDAQLSLLLFEADECEIRENLEGKKEKVYRGGSRGAFEKMARLREGAVVALLNPRILKPFQRSSEAPNPHTNLLALTPDSVDAVAVIGYAHDLGMCTATKKDGKPCGSWCDKRVADVCEFHVQRAVQGKRAARAEFSQGTGGMSSGPPKRKPAYDPAQRWGLKPTTTSTNLDGGATYVVSGHVVTGGSGPGQSSMFLAESIGREGQARAARRAVGKETEKALQKIVGRDREGMRAVVRAREVGLGATKEKVAKIGAGKAKSKERVEKEEDVAVVERKNAFSAAMVKQIGFDPTAVKTGGRRAEERGVKSKLDTLSALQNARSGIQLGPRPGKKATTVAVPEYARRIPPPSERTASRSAAIDVGEESDDELDDEELFPLGPISARANKEGDGDPPPMISLDSDDENLEGSDLEVEPPV